MSLTRSFKRMVGRKVQGVAIKQEVPVPPRIEAIQILPIEVEPSPAMVVVNSFDTCTCQCPAFADVHVSVRTYPTSLRQGEAVALSYAIGDWDRQHHLVGHAADDVQKVIPLQLGGEWDIAAFMSALVRICSENKAIWIDQLSIEQTPQMIQQELQRVPAIYSTLNVIALLPTAPCECLRDAVRRHEKKKASFARRMVGKVPPAFDINPIHRRCVNANPDCSYFRRLWTMQEFGFARRISLSFTKQSPPCIGRGTDWYVEENIEQTVGVMNEYTKHEWQRMTTLAAPLGSHATWGIDFMMTEFSDQADSRLRFFVHRFYYRGGLDPTGEDYDYFAARFLLGDQIQRPKSQIEGFVLFGHEIATPPSASVKEDYVLSMFPATQCYSIPGDWRTIGLAKLLEDALRQYERHHNEVIISTLPAGLFGRNAPTAPCRPSQYLDATTVRDYNDVFRTFQCSQASVITPDGHIPIQRSSGRPDRPSRLLRAQSYEKAFGGAPTQLVLDFMRRVADTVLEYNLAQTFAYSRQDTVLGTQAILTWSGRVEGPQNAWPNPELSLNMFRSLVCLSPEGFPSVMWGDLPEFDHHHAVRCILATWFGIDPQMTLEKNLGVIVAVGDPPCIGFVNGEVYNELLAVENGRLPAFRASDWLTLNTDIAGTDTMLAYELKQTDQVFDGPDGQKPIYNVVAVWLESPSNDPSIGGQFVSDFEGYDAVLW